MRTFIIGYQFYGEGLYLEKIKSNSPEEALHDFLDSSDEDRKIYRTVEEIIESVEDSICINIIEV